MQTKVQQSSQLRTLPLFISSRMETCDQNSGFPYNSNSSAAQDSESSSGFSGVLDIFVHHARDIHNICIYENQDVYLKFALTYNPDEAVSTKIIMGGGKNPDFNESIIMKINHPDAILKCEIWMFSRARNYMEDQLLGFALVPISSVVGKGKLTQTFSLSSTDLFHSPAGTVKLSLSLSASLSSNNISTSFSVSPPTSSISSEVVLVDRSVPSSIMDPVEYTSIEFPDINVLRENQKMVSEYFDLAGPPSDPRHDLVSTASFLCLGASTQPIEDCEMALNSNGNMQQSRYLILPGSSNEVRGSPNKPVHSKGRLEAESTSTVDASVKRHANQQSICSLTSKKQNEVSSHSSKDEEKESSLGPVKFGTSYSAATNVNNEAEQTVIQQQIVDMYMRSMQQFTESLAKMKLPMGLASPEHEEHSEVTQNRPSNSDMDNSKKDSSRVFYGSRAFF